MENLVKICHFGSILLLYGIHKNLKQDSPSYKLFMFKILKPFSEF